MKVARSCNSEDQRPNTRNLCSPVCVVTWLRRISPWVNCFRFIHPYAMRSYVCARSTAQFSPLSCLFCHQGNNRILETIISTCKRIQTHKHTHTHTHLYHIFSSVTTPSAQHLCLPPIIVLVKSFILIYYKKTCLGFSQTSYPINESLFSLVLKYISFTAWTSSIIWKEGLLYCWHFKNYTVC